MSWPTVEPGDVRPGVGLGDAVGPRADDGDELDLPVDGVADDLDVVERAGERRRELRERGRHLGHGHARLLGVAAVVEADGEHLPRAAGPGTGVAPRRAARSPVVTPSAKSTNAGQSS